MTDFSGYLIVTDLDATFFGSKTTVVPRNVEAMKKFIAGGGHISIATGRMHLNIRRPIPMLDEIINAPLIMCNGVYMFDMQRQEFASEHFMPESRTREVIDYLFREFPTAPARLSTRAGYVAESLDNPRVARDFSFLKPENRVIAPHTEWDLTFCYKIVVRGGEDDLAKAYKGLCERFGRDFNICFSGSEFLEVLPLGCNKSTMLEPLRDIVEELAGRKVRLIACGDYDNDLEMLEAADIAVSPSNALDRVKAVADYVLCSNNEGVIADVIELIERGEI